MIAGVSILLRWHRRRLMSTLNFRSSIRSLSVPSQTCPHQAVEKSTSRGWMGIYLGDRRQVESPESRICLLEMKFDIIYRELCNTNINTNINPVHTLCNPVPHICWWSSVTARVCFGALSLWTLFGPTCIPGWWASSEVELEPRRANRSCDRHTAAVAGV